MRPAPLFLMLIATNIFSLCQQAPLAPEQRAANAITAAFVVNPLLKKNEHFPVGGSWAVAHPAAAVLPTVCQDAGSICREVHYRVAQSMVDCSWVVLVPSDAGEEPVVLSENADAAHWLMRTRFSMGVMNNPVKEGLARPDYPPIAEAAHVSGQVAVKVVVDTDGKVTNASISTSSPNSDMLKGASLEAASRTRFEPLKLGDQAIVWSGFLLYSYQTLGLGTGNSTSQLKLLRNSGKTE